MKNLVVAYDEKIGRMVKADVLLDFWGWGLMPQKIQGATKRPVAN